MYVATANRGGDTAPVSPKPQRLFLRQLFTRKPQDLPKMKKTPKEMDPGPVSPHLGQQSAVPLEGGPANVFVMPAVKYMSATTPANRNQAPHAALAYSYLYKTDLPPPVLRSLNRHGTEEAIKAS